MGWIRRILPPAPPAPEPGVTSFYELRRRVRHLRSHLKQQRTSPDPAERARAENALLDIQDVLGAHPLNDDLVRLLERWETPPQPGAPHRT